jgi:hypothetical protein
MTFGLVPVGERNRIDEAVAANLRRRLRSVGKAPWLATPVPFSEEGRISRFNSEMNVIRKGGVNPLNGLPLDGGHKEVVRAIQGIERNTAPGRRPPLVPNVNPPRMDR